MGAAAAAPKWLTHLVGVGASNARAIAEQTALRNSSRRTGSRVAGSLLAGRHAHNIPGLAQEESDRLLRELIDFACQPPRIYHHDWTPGDAVVWDNRCLMHQATPWDMTQRRIMWHSRIAGDPASESALAA